ncbi:serine/threonine-protein kinase [Bizionia arctica]|uniref:Protein kinase domain-containing protein n=1 Tax=Bizionia arctica TaxID=1495645 RepID=A0A917GGV5_9FLAO|nr:serine/threonine-protein kinase [Bizionia arctica]GGG44962.1 hypothetical protein GCM10010976_15700 [Bizionia arctica]
MTQQEFRKRYEFDIKTDNIGGGSFGTVYKAYDTVLDREVAIKVSEVKTVGDKEFSLLEEYKAIEKLSEHKNIANYEKVYRFESFPAIYDYGIMQYYASGNLSHYLKNNEVSLEKREKITRGVLEGIAFLHQHQVVHRDLKPSNVLVVDRRGELIPKITDFGLSKQAEGDGKASRFTNSFAGGTLQYSSPEQLKGLPLKLNTDLWSFGAIAYEILTGNTLFDADNQGTATAEWQNTITQKILHHDVSEQLKALPENWKKVVKACLERDLRKRVQSSEALFAILNNEGTSNGEENNIPPVINNDATIIRGSVNEKQPIKPQPLAQKPIAQKIVSKKTTPMPKKEKPKWLIPSIAAAVITLIGTVGYFMFATDDIEPVKNKLAVFKEGNLYGYKEGELIVIAPQYLMAEDFTTEIDSVKVATKDSIFYINRKGIWLATITDSTAVEQEVADEEKNTVLTADESAWNVARKANTKASYEKYLRDFKSGDYRKSANNAISSLENKSDIQPVSSKILNQKELEKWAAVSSNMDNALKAANNGDANAQIRMAEVNQHVYGKPEEAEKWYLKAAIKGNAIAQGELGAMYDEYTGRIRDGKKSEKWIRKSANQGYAEAEYNLGYIYSLGYYGVAENKAEAIKWWLKAANQGHITAMHYLAEAYKSQKNYEDALIWYKKLANAAKPGDYYYTTAEDDIAEFYYKGYGVAKDYQESLKWYEKVANLNTEGNSNYKYGIGQIYYHGGYGVSRDYNEAMKWFKSAACEDCKTIYVGMNGSRFLLGQMYENGEGVDKNMQEAIRYYELASSRESYYYDHYKDAQNALIRLGE